MKTPLQLNSKSQNTRGHLIPTVCCVTAKRFIGLAFTFCILLIMTFQVKGQTLTLLSPNGGEIWMNGTTQTITWQWDGNSTEVYIYYSPDEGVNWYFISNADSEATSLQITADLSVGDLSKIKVISADVPGITDASDGNFTVLFNPVYFSTPSPGQQFFPGEMAVFLWDTFAFQNYNLSFSPDGGLNWTELISDSPLNFYEWEIPQLNSTQCMIKVSDTEDTTVYGLSANFSIMDPPEATFTSPVGGETWTYGEDVTISWTGSNITSVVYLDYSVDGGQNWKYLSNANSDPTSGSLTISIPKVSTTNAKIRMLDANYNIIIGMTDEFTIYVPPVMVYYPYDGQEFYVNGPLILYWLVYNVELVNVDLSYDGGENWETILTDMDAELISYNWTISGQPSNNCLVKIYDASDPTKFGISGNFSILDPPVITLTNPNGNELWRTETEYTVSWTYDNPEFYYLIAEYSVDSGANWYNIANGLPPQGSIDWKTPATESENCFIRIYDSNLDIVSDTSGIFTISNYPESPICIVSVDSASNQNIIIWEKPETDRIRDYIVYKETNQTEVFEPIGTVAYDSLPLFIDVNSNPAVKSNRYKLGFDDNEGTVYPMGDMHQTIHLTISKGVGSSWNLNWGAYLGFDVASYYIYRSSNGDEFQLIETISSSFFSYTDFNAPDGEVYYFIEVVNENGCSLTSREITVNNAISNIVSNNFLDISTPDNLLVGHIYPNPVNQTLNIITGSESGSLLLQVCDLNGKIISEQNFGQVSANYHLQLNTSDFGNGIYVLKIKNDETMLTKKVVVRH